MSHLERRMESFDQFFLFITSVLGLFFSLLYALLGYREIVYGFLPLLIIGLVIPIYIGYVRGAILLDSLEERVRGWIYFLYGVAIYLGATVLFIFNRLLLTLNIEFEQFSGLLLFGGGILIGYFLGGRRLHRWFCRNIFKAFDHRITKLTDKIYDDTSSSAYNISSFLFISFILSISENFDLTLAFMMIFFISFGLVFFMLWERSIRKWLSLVRFSSFVEVDSKTKQYVPSMVRVILLPISFIVIVAYSFLSKWLTVPAKVGLITVFGFCLILLNLSIQTEYTPVKRKDVPKNIETELTNLIDRITKKKQKHKKQEND